MSDTRQRVAVREELARDDAFRSAQEVHARLRATGTRIGLTTVYRALQAMAERGIDISGEFPKPWTDETVRAADVVISMGCGDACLIFPGKRYESWDDLDDPATADLAHLRVIRDDIERRVRTLLASIHTPA